MVPRRRKIMVKVQKIIFVLLLICFSKTGQNAFAQTQKSFECKATYYHNRFENRKTSSGEIFTQRKYTAAHKTLPMHTLVKVTNLSNGLSVLVKVNDRCPKQGIIDLSYIAAKDIMLHKTGVAKVRVDIIEENYKGTPEKQELIAQKPATVKKPEGVKKEEETTPKIQQDLVVDTVEIQKETPLEYSFFVRICSIERTEDLEMITGQLPIEYKNNTTLENVFNQAYYYVNIGPFSSINLAEQALKTIKSTYKSAYIVKKK